MRFVIAVIIFSVVILIHELGHFLLAKKNHIEVLEFSLGMGPRIISTVKGGTRYSVKLFPLGGSCAMAGEDAEDDSPGTFNSAPVWGRIAVVAAGPIFNFLLAFVLSVIIVGCMGYDPATVLEVTQNSAAEKAGLKKGDVITEYQGYHIDLGKDLYVYSYLNELKEGDTIRLKVKRDGKEQEISYKPDVNVRYLLGFNRSDVNSMTVESLIKGMPLEEAGLEAGDVIDLGGRELEVFHIPGHTPGSILLLDRKCRVLLSGDTCARRLLYGLHEQVSFEEFCASLENLKTADFDVMYSAHDRCAIPKEYLSHMMLLLKNEVPQTKNVVDLPGIGEMKCFFHGDIRTLDYFDIAFMEEPIKDISKIRLNVQ